MAAATRRATPIRCRISSSWPRPITRVGIRCEKPGELDDAIKEMIEVDKPVIFDCVVDQTENCFPMIPSGRAHNEMLLGDAAEKHRGCDHRRRQDAGVRLRAASRMSVTSYRAAHSHYPAATRHERIETPHPLGHRRQRARRAGARHRPVLRPRLQHQLAHGVGDGAPEASLAHHHRHARHADGDRADQEPARAPGAGRIAWST